MRTRLSGAVLAAGVASVALTGLNGAGAAPSSAQTAASVAVTVHAGQSLGVSAAGAVGVNTPIWNPHLLDKPVPALLRQAGIQTLVFNGGGVSDLYHWRTGTLSPDPDPKTHPYDYAALKPQFSFDQFADTAKKIGAHMLVHVNYGTGTPAEAAAWVRQADVINHDGVRDWEIGEEVYLNGGLSPALNFEPDAHADKSAAAYAKNVLAYSKAMKAVDPTIQVGVGLYPVAQPGNPLWTWDQTVLRIAGRAIDFVDLHWYPLSEQTNTSDKSVPASVGQIPATMSAMQGLVTQNAGPATHRVQLIVGETNSAVASASQQISLVNALYLANTSLTLLEHGAAGVDLTEAPLDLACKESKSRELTNLRLITGDAMHLPFEADTFDVVLCCLALHHMEDPHGVLDEMARVCRIGGRLAIEDLSASDHPTRAAYQNEIEILRDPSHVRALSLHELVRLPAEADLEVESVQTYTNVQQVERWLANAHTPEDRAAKVRALLVRDEERDLSGMRPFNEAVELSFTHRMAVIVARKLGA